MRVMTRTNPAWARPREVPRVASLGSLRVLAMVLATVLLAAHARPALAQRESDARMQGMSASMRMDRAVRTLVRTDLLEYSANESGGGLELDAVGWIGGDYNRLWIRAEGSQPTEWRGGDWQLDAYYGRLVSPFWTALIGARLDTRVVRERRVARGLVAVGLEGIAPYWFEMEPTLLVSQEGDVSAQFTTAFDLLVTQRLVLQPRLEMNAAVQRVPAFNIAPGLNDIEVGARARYEFRRELAPYVGVNWQRRTSGTASLARQAGEHVSDIALVVGLRVWH